ncbi:hypothetical protein [Corynebacterium lizhenjunii]|nr:hypothetical protein [Corynebacterium lizhenjunii]
MTCHFPVRATCAVLTIGAAVALGACSSVPNVPSPEEQAAVGHASPAPSPSTASQDKLPGSVIDFPAVQDIEASGSQFAVRTADAVFIGSASSFAAAGTRSGSGTAGPVKVAVDAACGDLTPAEGAFILACGDNVLVMPTDNPGQTTTVAVAEDFPVTAATRTSSGELFVASDSAAKVAVYRDGERVDDFSVAAPTDQLVSVRNQDGQDNVVRIWREDTTIQNLDWENSREGGRLRVGAGVGQISDGLHGVVVAADTNGKRVAIYTAEDVVRLHQFGNTDGTPWATAWDEHRQLAWVTTTDNNQAQAFRIATGVPEPQGSFATLADAHHIAVADDGTVLLGSASGGGLQLLDSLPFDAKESAAKNSATQDSAASESAAAPKN